LACGHRTDNNGAHSNLVTYQLVSGLLTHYTLSGPYLCHLLNVQDIIIGNIPGARGTDVIFDTKHDHDLKRVSNTLTNDVKVTQDVTSEQYNSETECSETDDSGPSIEQVASVQTRAMVEKENNQ